VARVLGLSLPFAIHLAKLATTPLLLAAVYRFVAHFTAWQVMRRLSFFLVAVGGGLGWLWVLIGGPFELGAMPTDLWVPDASAFLTMITFPHLAVAQALVLWVAICGLQLIHAPGWRRTLTAGLLGLLLSLVHPYSLPVVLGLLGVYWAVRAWRIRRPSWVPLLQLATVGLAAAPYLAYSYLLFAGNPVFHSWQAQNRIESPAPLHYLLGFGLLGPLALIGLLSPRPLRRWRDDGFLMLWVVLIPVGLYIPSNLQRRFLDGYQAVLVLAAVTGLIVVLHRVPCGWRSRLMWLVGGISVLTNLVLLIGFLALVAARPATVFNQPEVLEAMDWLAAHAAPDSVVLAAYNTGNLLPTRAVVRTFIGHGPQSVNVEEKRAQLGAFFGVQASDEQRLALLAAYHIDYIFYGPSERALGDFSLATLPVLQQVYDNGVVRVYQIPSETRFLKENGFLESVQHQMLNHLFIAFNVALDEPTVGVR
jgi:hypothetical protein